MTDTPTAPSATLTPWLVLIWPDYYDDDGDVGFMWAGDAADEEDAVRQACKACDDANSDENGPIHGAIDPEEVKVVEAGPDWQKLFERLKVVAASAAEYVERFADLNGEPEGGDCRAVLAKLREITA